MKADYCAICVAEWWDKPVEERKKSVPTPALTTVKRMRLCAPHAAASQIVREHMGLLVEAERVKA